MLGAALDKALAGSSSGPGPVHLSIHYLPYRSRTRWWHGGKVTWQPVMPTPAWPTRSWAGQQPWVWTGCVSVCLSWKGDEQARKGNSGLGCLRASSNHLLSAQVKICGAGRSRTRQALGHRPEDLLTRDQKGRGAAACFPISSGPCTLMLWGQAEATLPQMPAACSALQANLCLAPLTRKKPGSFQPISSRVQELVGPLEPARARGLGP